MEILILLCLVIIIALLLQDKITFNVRTFSQSKKERPIDRSTGEISGIMGAPKAKTNQEYSLGAVVAQDVKISSAAAEISEDINLEIKLDEYEDAPTIQFDFEEEEEEWRNNNNFYSEGGFATGVTFEELKTVGAFVLDEISEAALEMTTLQIVQKLQGTELLDLLESGMDGAAKRIAMLLEINVNKSNFGSINSIGKDKDFDIKNFS